MFIPIMETREHSVTEDRRRSKHAHCRRRRFIAFAFCFICCLSIAALVFGIGSMSLPVSTPVPSPPAVDCDYSEWTVWSFYCNEYPPGVYSQVRSQNSNVISSSCPQIIEHRDCVPETTLLQNRYVTSYNCDYDVYTNLCNGSSWVTHVTPFPITNATDLTLYQATVQPANGWINFHFGSIYPCLGGCPLSNASATPVPAPCEYPEWSAWSSTCIEYPTGNFSVARTATASPYYYHCPDLVEREECTPLTCALTFVLSSSSLACSYNASTNLCASSGGVLNYTTWCATNATDLDAFYATTGFSVETHVHFPTSPCDPLCPVTNGSTPFTPVPSDNTPQAACTYGGWSAWSVSCVEYPTGVFARVRVRQPDPPYSYCLDTDDRQYCGNMDDCDEITEVVEEVFCVYSDITGFCNYSATTVTTTTRCATNATNLTLYYEEVPGSGQTTFVPFIQPCLLQCGPSDYDVVPSPIPTPSVMCNYSDWGELSFECFEYPTGTYFQAATRYADPPYSFCNDLILRVDCDTDVCDQQLYQATTPTCFFSETTGFCDHTNYNIINALTCVTNATNLTAYILHFNDYSSTFIFNVQPCDPACPTSTGIVPPPPPPIVCTYTEWSFWSPLCYEYPTGVYWQNRSKTPSDLSCAAVTEKQECYPLGGQCQLYYEVNTTNVCKYNSSNLCANATVLTFTTGYCNTNASNITLYEAIVIPTTFGGIVPGVVPCPSDCPPTDPDPVAIVETYEVLIIAIPPLTCVPPEYALGDNCVLCTNTSACTRGLLDPVRNLCQQVSACVDVSPCLLGTCNISTGVCVYLPKTANDFNASIQFVCTDDGRVITTPVLNFDATLVVTCDDSNPATIDHMDPVTQRCISVTPVNSSSTVVVSACINGSYTASPYTSVPSLVIEDKYFPCASGDKYCGNGVCNNVGSIDPVACSYDTLQVIPSPIVGVASTYFYAKTYDDSRCTDTTLQYPFGICVPTLCPNTLSGCGYTGVGKQQQNIIYISTDFACCYDNTDCLALCECDISQNCVC